MFQQGEDDTKCKKNGIQGKENKTQIKIQFNQCQALCGMKTNKSLYSLHLNDEMLQ